MQWIGHALTAIAISAVFALLARLIPFRASQKVSPAEAEALEKEYRWVDIALLPLFLTSAGLLTWLWGRLLNQLADWRLTHLPPSLFLITPEPRWAFWLLPGMLLGIVTSAIPMTLTARLILGDRRYTRYLLASQLRRRYDIRKATHILFGSVGLIVALFVTLGLNWYAQFREDDIRIHPFFSLHEQLYNYDEISGLVMTSHLKAHAGNIVSRARWFIIFNDGNRWCNEDVLSRPQEDDRRLRSFLQTKTGKAWRHAQFIEDVPCEPRTTSIQRRR